MNSYVFFWNSQLIVQLSLVDFDVKTHSLEHKVYIKTNICLFVDTSKTYLVDSLICVIDSYMSYVILNVLFMFLTLSLHIKVNQA